MKKMTKNAKNVAKIANYFEINYFFSYFIN